MPLRNSVRMGEWLVTADCCGKTRYASEVRRGVSEQQRGLVICNEHWEPRHPLQDRPAAGPESRRSWPLTGDRRNMDNDTLTADQQTALDKAGLIDG